MDNNNELTSREFWLDYWKQKMDRGEITRIEDAYLFSDVLIRNAQRSPDSSVLEIGGFPGVFALFLKRKAHVKAAIFDYIIHREFLQEFLKKNGFGNEDLDLYEGDVFQYVPEKQYGMVFSVGLIEHFEDTAGIIGKHLPFCLPGGRILILLPNFTGINGWMNKTFDPENYNIHNIRSMDPGLLERSARNLGLENVRVYYHGRFGLWLENYAGQSVFAKAFFKTIWFCGKVLTRVIPFESRFLSPYIILEGDKPSNPA
ncbi:MAG: methyltransferase domain-containing protein [Flavobacteriales bacterium]